MPALNDGTDNDLDGLIDEADEGDILELTSTGYCDQVAKTVRATLVPRYRVPWLTGAVYIGDPTANVTLSGNALLISGTKVSLAGLPTGGAGTGIGVAGDPGFVRDQIAPGVLDNIVGQPKVGEVEYYDLQLLVEQGAKAANVRLVDGETSMPDSPGAWGTLLAPAVVYGAGDIKIAGGAGGVGLLVVDGHLEITGGFDWQGLVIVRGGVTLSGGGGGKRIIGALVVDDAVRTEESDDPASASVDGTGTIDILFSPDGLQLVRDSFTTTYMLTNWREGPNPDVAAETTP